MKPTPKNLQVFLPEGTPVGIYVADRKIVIGAMTDLKLFRLTTFYIFDS